MLNQITALLNTIFLNYLSNTHCSFMVIDHSVHFEPFTIPVIIFNISNHQENTIINFDHHCQGFVIFTKYPRRVFDTIEEEMYNDDQSPYKMNGRKYLFVLQKSNADWSEIYQSKYLRYIPNVIFIVEDDLTPRQELNFKWTDKENTVYSIFTHSYVGINYSEPILLDMWFSCNQSFAIRNNLFPDKTKNLQGKPINIAAFTYNPYVVVGTSYFDSYGIDVRLIQEFISRHNATAMLKVAKTETWGMQYSNKSKATGLLVELVYNDADIVLGGYMYILHSYHYLDFTKPHYSSRLNALVPKTRMLSQIPLPIYPFTLGVWLLIFCSFLTSIFTLYLGIYLHTSKNQNGHLTFGEIIMKVYSIYLQQFNYLPKLTERYKMVVIWIFVVGIFISTIYSSRMTSLLTIPRYEKPISNLEDLIKSDLKIGTTNIPDYLLPLVNSEIDSDQKILSHFLEYNWTVIRMLTEKGEIGALTEKTQSENYAVNGITKKELSQLQIVHDPICYYHLLLCTRKNFALLGVFNKFVGRVVESGLTKFWEDEAIFVHSNVTLQNMIKWSTHRDPVLRKLNFEQAEGALLILFGGILLSLFVFIYELFSYHYASIN